jgi:thiamine biosynthesis lipoprotein
LADCPDEVIEVLTLARGLQRATGGAFDPGWQGGRPDPTGLVKGWAAERASLALCAAGLGDHLVNAAGDVRTRGRWAIGIAHPLRPGLLVAVVDGHDLAVATSGTAELGGHVVDTRIGMPALALASVTVVGADLATADAFATAGLARGADAYDLLDDLDRDGWPSLVVTATGEVRASAGFTWAAEPAGITPVAG